MSSTGIIINVAGYSLKLVVELVASTSHGKVANRSSPDDIDEILAARQPINIKQTHDPSNNVWSDRIWFSSIAQNLVIKDNPSVPNTTSAVSECLAFIIVHFYNSPLLMFFNKLWKAQIFQFSQRNHLASNFYCFFILSVDDEWGMFLLEVTRIWYLLDCEQSLLFPPVIVPSAEIERGNERGNERGSVGVRALSGKWNVDQLLRRSYQILRKFEDMFKLSDMDEILFKLC